MKDIIAFAQGYFAVPTRKQELKIFHCGKEIYSI